MDCQSCFLSLCNGIHHFPSPVDRIPTRKHLGNARLSSSLLHLYPTFIVELQLGQKFFPSRSLLLLTCGLDDHVEAPQTRIP